MIPIATRVATSVRAAINQPQLRDYQHDTYNNIKSSWDAGNNNVLAVLPTGGGKTVVLSRIVFDYPGASCVIAHRQELVSQISIALARNGVRHRIIGPDNVIRNIVQLHMFELGMSFYDPNAKCAVAGVDTLARRMGTGEDGEDYYYKDKIGELWYYEPRINGMWRIPTRIDTLPSGTIAKRVKPASIDPQIAKWAPGVKLWVTDECFPAGTLIDGKPIELIKIGDYVNAFNESTGEFEYKKVVTLFKNPAPEIMMRIETITHNVLNCTKGHPFWTKRGWVNACDLTLNDEVLINVKQSSQFVRLGSISIHESRDLKQSDECAFDGYVYNIEVEDLHTYVANNIVVHNCHHLLRDNKWGRAITLFPNALGLGVTATPERSDGAGLGRHADGVFDDLIVGPTMRELINRDYLTDYDIVVPPSNLTLNDKDISKATGDYKRSAMVNAVEHSSLVGDDDGKRRVIGDIVHCYEKFAKGKLGVTFVPSVKIGERVKQQFIDQGIPAELVTAETPDLDRARILRQFKNRDVMNLINVDLFGEGFDLPAIEVVSMARPTQSYGLYVQQFGRALRLLDGKKKALIIDHVGNVLGPRGHGLPDSPRMWTLDRRDKRATGPGDDAIPLRRCGNIECFRAYERYLTTCPHCGTPIPEPMGRNDPEFVDGDLYMLDEATLIKLRGIVDDTDKPVNEMAQDYHDELQRKHCPLAHVMRNVRIQSDKHRDRQDAQLLMRTAFSQWAGYRRSEGLSNREIYRKFYLIFGINYMTAMALHNEKALDITNRLLNLCR